MARHILEKIASGIPWQSASANAFGGGSYGNGAAMRVAPLGAYFAEDLDLVSVQATRSARVTHSHPQGIAGAIAVAIATATALQKRNSATDQAIASIWSNVLEHTPEGEVHDQLEKAYQMRGTSTGEAARSLGNGSNISAQDTVPFCIWNACNCLGDYKEAFYSTVEVGGDCDTNSAIVGAIVTAYLGDSSIPQEWLRVREKLSLTFSS